MKNKSGLHALLVKANPVLEMPESVQDFNSQRFYIAAPNAMQVSISGSSESKMHAVVRQPVLDASYIQCDDQLNMAMATADGLGESEDDPADNQNNADIAAFCAESICQTLPLLNRAEFMPAMQDVARQSKENNQSAQDGLPYEARTAVAALFYQADTWRAHVLGMGDVLTVVFDGKTGALKYQQKARVYQQGKAAWAPIDIQMLASSKPTVAAFAAQALQKETWVLADDDIIVQMSDGIWSEFPTSDQEIAQNDARYIESSMPVGTTIQALAPEAFATRTLDTLHALDIALILQHKAMQHFQEKIACFKQIQQPLSEALARATSGNQSMRMFVSKLDPEVAAIFNRLFVNEQHDAMPYHPEMPVSLFYQHFQKISFGDCATLSVLKIPSAAQRSLVLILQDMPALVQHAADVTKLAQLGQETIERLFATLSQQRCTIGEKQRLVADDPVSFTKPAYDPTVLATLKAFICHYAAYQQAENAGTSPALKRKCGLTYLQSMKNQEERRFLAHYLDKVTACTVIDYLSLLMFKPADNGVTVDQYKKELRVYCR